MNSFKILASIASSVSVSSVGQSLPCVTLLQARNITNLGQGLRYRSIPWQRYCSTAAGTSGEGPVQKQSLFQRFKSMYKDYWYVLVPVHVVTSLGWIGGFYYTVSSGFDLGYYMRQVGLSESLVDKVTRSGAGNLAVAYALYKIATPARYAVTLGGTTMAINRLTKWGYIRPAKEIYSSNKEKFKTFQKNLGEKRKGKGSNTKGTHEDKLP